MNSHLIEFVYLERETRRGLVKGGPPGSKHESVALGFEELRAEAEALVKAYDEYHEVKPAGGPSKKQKTDDSALSAGSAGAQPALSRRKSRASASIAKEN